MHTSQQRGGPLEYFLFRTFWRHLPHRLPGAYALSPTTRAPLGPDYLGYPAVVPIPTKLDPIDPGYFDVSLGYWVLEHRWKLQSTVAAAAVVDAAGGDDKIGQCHWAEVGVDDNGAPWEPGRRRRRQRPGMAKRAADGSGGGRRRLQLTAVTVASGSI